MVHIRFLDFVAELKPRFNCKASFQWRSPNPGLPTDMCRSRPGINYSNFVATKNRPPPERRYKSWEPRHVRYTRNLLLVFHSEENRRLKVRNPVIYLEVYPKTSSFYIARGDIHPWDLSSEVKPSDYS